MNYKAVVSVLILVIIVLASVMVVQHQMQASQQLPFHIGSPVTPASDMPAGMVMETYTMPATEPVPTIALTVTKNTMANGSSDGWTVDVATTNFMFAPDHLDLAPLPGEGHVHLYIDNQLIIMLGPSYHIDSLNSGTHTIRVGLFNNDHSAYSVNGNNIQAQQTITVQ